MGAAVTLAGLSVSFFKRTVLHNINAVFPAKAISVLVGRSGSGKTTLLRAINRLNEEFPGCVTSGRVHVDFGRGLCDIHAKTHKGGEAISLPELRLRVGMLFQTPNCFPVSVYRNIAMPLTLVGGVAAGEAPGRVQASLASVGLWEELKDRLDAPAERLSGGQQQRLCLARLLALQPSILLLDEPTANLDVHAGREIEELLQNLASRYTLIMVSHSLRQAGRMADQVLVCEAGTIAGTFAGGTQPDEDLLAGLLRSSGEKREPSHNSSP